jgi:hypothetical protein
MKKKKRGQEHLEGGKAAGLVGLIIVVVVLYIIFLPPEERNELLGEEDNGKTSSSEKETNLTLLSENPGTISFIGQKDADKSIPNIYLYKDTNAQVIEKFNDFYVRNGYFDKIRKNITFSINDLENTDNVMLSFTTAKNTGILTIKLNDEIIYEYDISTLNVNPIELKKSSLKQNNILDFSVGGVGWMFWKTNEYSFENVKVIGDITDVTGQKSRNVFTLTEAEYQNIDKSELKFVPYCKYEGDVGVLEAFINNRNVYSAVPVCDDPVKQPFSIDILNSGENNVVFKSTKGSYSIEQITLELNLKETQKIIYYFELNESQYLNITKEGKNVNLYITFVEDDEEKKLDLSINGHLTSIRQDESKYKKDISHWIEEGNNYIEIRPKTTLYIVKLEIKYED